MLEMSCWNRVFLYFPLLPFPLWSSNAARKFIMLYMLMLFYTVLPRQVLYNPGFLSHVGLALLYEPVEKDLLIETSWTLNYRLSVQQLQFRSNAQYPFAATSLYNIIFITLAHSHGLRALRFKYTCECAKSVSCGHVKGLIEPPLLAAAGWSCILISDSIQAPPGIYNKGCVQ